MSNWQQASIKFDPFGTLKGPVKSVLTILQTVEAILESLLSLLKALGVFLTNPLSGVISLLLATIRLIINQLRSTGFNLLAVIPDFSRGDMAQVLASVSGAYPGFEKKVVYKFRDQSDLYRPTYPDGSMVAMVVFYIGADTPGDLLGQLFSLLSFINAPSPKTLLPSPVNLKVSPVAASDDPFSTAVDVGTQAVTQYENIVSVFKSITKASYEPALLLEWRMPTGTGGVRAPGFLNPAISFYNSYRFPNFLIERSEYPTGRTIEVEISTPTVNKDVAEKQSAYKVPKSPTKATLKDSDQITPFRLFDFRKSITTSRNVEGAFTGTYRFKDDTVEAGKSYYYRVRAYYGDISNYVNSKYTDFNSSNTSLVRLTNNKPFVFYGQNATVGRPSSIIRGIAPVRVNGWDPYDDLYKATLAGVLLNFDLPHALDSDSPTVKEQKTGWGTLSMVGGAIAPYKISLKNSKDIKESKMIKFAVRRLVNSVLNYIVTNATVSQKLLQQWSLVSARVNALIQTDLVWQFPEYSWGDVTGGISSNVNTKINEYLAKETYSNGQKEFAGPFPTFPWEGQGITNYSRADRLLLASFLDSVYSSISASSGYLRWYSLTLGDIFPAFIPFIFDLEQFILSVLKAYNNIMQEIANVISTIISKIRQLELIIKAIIAMMDLLSINLTASVLAYATNDGGVENLIDALQNSENKPSSSPFGLHSGIVITAGMPGRGVVRLLEALGFVLGIKLVPDGV